MNCIFRDKNKIKLGWYNYHRNSDSFSYGFGTTQRTYTSYCDLGLEVLAEISFEKIHKGWFYEYPENNTLTVYLRENCDVEITEDLIKSLKGYKKYFGKCNIKKILIK